MMGQDPQEHGVLVALILVYTAVVAGLALATVW